MTLLPATIDATAALLQDGGYVADRALATTVHLALAMARPLFLEGEPGTGKTEIARVLAAGLGRRLVRLQCYDGMDLAAAAYEWDRARQLLAIRLAEAQGNTAAVARDIYAREYLQARPLLAAIDPDLPPAVLLIDELDRADEPFEAFLLELLADFQITVPEFGTIRATHPARRRAYQQPHAGGARRDSPPLPVSVGGLPGCRARTRHPTCPRARPARTPVRPGGGVPCSNCAGPSCSSCRVSAETIDWSRALAHMNRVELTPEAVDATLGVLLKYQDDIAKVRGATAAAMVAGVKDAA